MKKRMCLFIPLYVVTFFLTTAFVSLPHEEINANAAEQIAGGQYHSLAVRSDGTVWAWGLNSAGQLGDGTRINSNTPVQVSGLSDAIAIAGGGWHNLAIKSDGTVWAWGFNYNGQLGDGTNTDSNIPIQVSGLVMSPPLVQGGTTVLP